MKRAWPKYMSTEREVEIFMLYFEDRSYRTNEWVVIEDDEEEWV